ncbi:MAG: formimidoylglutamate deiminase [Nocardioidaceae bacterium]|nr:formimidoylglutamate deiminase [Nocardioidaceae bacterium]
MTAEVVDQRYHLPYAWLPGGVARDVTLSVRAGRWVRVVSDDPGDGAEQLPGLGLPGLANAHSHAFHRALRGRTHVGGTFWTWRQAMYDISARLDPDSYLALARAAYAEMALAGITTVAEFHYVHHQPCGAPYADPNVMGHALAQAARDAGIRLTLLDTCYLTGGLSQSGELPLAPEQRRFADADADAWAVRVAGLADAPGLRIGVAAHSVRAVPPSALRRVVEVAAGRPLHVHVSEQPAENAACQAVHGCSPVQLLAEHAVLAPMTSLVHATHLSDSDVSTIAASGSRVCLCPTTERDLADGIGPAARLAAAGVPLSLGTDQHAVVDVFEEMRAVEMHERVRTLQRGVFEPAALLAAATDHAGLGWPDAGRLEVGARADLVTVRTDTVRTAGAAPAQVLSAATAADVDTVLVAGEPVVRAGRHRMGDVGAMLVAAIGALC